MRDRRIELRASGVQAENKKGLQFLATLGATALPSLDSNQGPHD